MFTIFDTLNSAFTFIATAYIYFMAIALLLLIAQAAIAFQSPTISDEFYQQAKALMADDTESFEKEETKVSISVTPQKATEPSGKALVITVSTEFPQTAWNMVDGAFGGEATCGQVHADKYMRTSPLFVCLSPKTRLGESDRFRLMNLRNIRAYIRDHQLQEMIRSALGKSVSECRLDELRGALEDYVADRQYELAQELV